MSDKITLRGKRVSIVAVHEAGHALAMYVIGTHWGYECPINSITMHSDQGRLIHSRGVFDVYEGAATSGPGMTPAMRAVVGPGTDLEDNLARCRAAGINHLDAWARDFILIRMAGPAAQWVYEGKRIPFAKMIQPEDSPGRVDFLDAICAFYAAAELPRDGDRSACNATISKEASRAVKLVEVNRRAISALAVALPREGNIDGKRVSEILRANVAGIVRPSYVAEAGGTDA